MIKGPESKGAPRKLSLKEKSISGLSWFVRAAIISLALAGCDKDNNNNPDGGTDAGTDPIVDCINNTDCVDTDLCNGEETCNLTSYTCVDGTPIDHDDGDACNGVETCDPSDGSMIPGTPIDHDDGDACNGLETCDPSDGSMIPGTPMDCDDLNDCTTDTCSASTCDNDPLPNVGNSCDDLDAGTEDDVCQTDGSCEGVEIPVPTVDVGLNALGYPQLSSGSVTLSSTNATSCTTNLTGAVWQTPGDNPGSATSGTFNFDVTAPSGGSVDVETTCTGPGGDSDPVSDSAPVF